MHDFNCTRADDMNYKLMADRTRYLKENPKGVSEMCRIMEDMRNESLREGMQEEKRMAALRMLSDEMLAAEKIAEYAGLPIGEVEKLKTKEMI